MSTEPAVIISPPEEQQFSTQATAIVSQLRAIVVVDQDTYDLAAAKLNERADWKKNVIAFFKPMKDATHKAHKAIIDRETSVLSVGEAEDAATRQSLRKFIDDRERKRKADELLAAQAQKKLEDDAKVEAAEKAQAMGASAEVVEQIMTEPISAPAPVVQQSYTKAAGVGTVKVWKWRPEGAVSADQASDQQKLAALKKLVKAAAKDDRLLAYLLLNESGLTSHAKSAKSAASVPCINFYDQSSVRIGGR